MAMYYDKCGCGQPYDFKGDGNFPMKDTFTTSCPSCGKQLTHKSSSLNVEWNFDPSFNKED